MNKLISLSGIVFSIVCFSQVPYKVLDLHSEKGIHTGSYPSRMVEANGLFFFRAKDDDHGEELWVTDGTEQGTRFVKDIFPGREGSSITFLGGTDNFCLFAADDMSYGKELWYSDGTAAGTYLLKDFIEGIDDGGPYYFEAVGSTSEKVYFRYGYNSFWCSDGTLIGTVDLGSYSQILDFIEIENLVYYSGHSDQGYGLWVSDGTQIGTTKLLDYYISSIRPFQSRLFFVFDADPFGREIGSCDFSGQDFQVLKDIKPGQGDSISSPLYVINDLLLFAASDGISGDEPWKSDGTEDGTEMVLDIDATGSSLSWTSNTFYQTDHFLFFLAETNETGRELWQTDGTESGTKMVHEPVIGPPSTRHGGLAATNEFLYFFIRNGYSYELFCTDGIFDEPIMLMDQVESRTGFLGTKGSDSFFGIGIENGDVELWMSDGTYDGTNLLKDLHTYKDHLLIDSLSAAGPNLAFRAENENVFDLWLTQGLSELSQSVYQGNFTGLSAIGERLLFSYRTTLTDPDEYWKLTSSVPPHDTFSDLYASQSYFPSFLEWGQSVIGLQYRGLFELDPTGQFQRLTTTYFRSRYDEPIAIMDGYFYFSGDDDVTGEELWRSDGTAEGTVLIKDIHATYGSNPSEIIRLNDQVIFSAKERDSGRELWQSDGTESGTTLLKDILEGQPSSDPHAFLDLDQVLLFIATTDTTGRELWVTDGTEPGTQVLNDIYPGQGSSMPAVETMSKTFRFAKAGSQAFFSANDGIHGLELWTSDGTIQGTRMLKDIIPGQEGSMPTYLIEFGGKVFFVATDLDHGRELWETDGTEQGTLMVQDLTPGTAGSHPEDLFVNQDLLYFTCNSNSEGRRLWALGFEPNTTIFTTETFCQGSTQNRAYVPHLHDEAIYSWSLTGGTIESGQGTSEIHFSVEDGAQIQIGVNVTVGGVLAASSLNLPVLSSPPDSVTAIQGPTEFCAYPGMVTYTTNAVPNADTYQWQVPPESVIVSGQGTMEVTVQIGDQSGTMSVRAGNACGLGPETQLPITILSTPSIAFAGMNQVACYDITQLEATEPQQGTGTWTILSGAGGYLHDAQAADSLFEGQIGSAYILEWTITTPQCGSTSDQVQIIFADPPPQANAGLDQAVCGDFTVLDGNEGTYAVGVWSILDGRAGSFSNRFDPNATFYGIPGETYRLEWQLNGQPCSVSADEVEITLGGVLVSDPGPDMCMNDATSTRLQAYIKYGVGNWSLTNGPSIAIEQIQDPSDPMTLFTPQAGPGIYVLQWTASNPGCQEQTGTISISVLPQNQMTSILDSIPRPPDDSGSEPEEIVEMNGVFYYTANISTYRDKERALFRSDATEAGTYPLLQIDSIHYPRSLFPVENHLYFKIDDELWVTDGTNVGTRKIEIDSEGAQISSVNLLGAHNNQLIFETDGDTSTLWMTDGSTGGTKQLFQMPTQRSPASSYREPISSRAQIGNRSFFDWNGLWTTDGSVEGTYPIAPPGELEHFRINTDIVILNGGIIFGERNNLYGEPTNLYYSNGTFDGTRVIETRHNGQTARSFGHLTVFKGYAFFSAYTNDTGSELWRTDGTTEGTRLLKELGATSDSGIDSNTKLHVNDDLMFINNWTGLWVSDGTENGTEFIFESTYLISLGSYNGLVFFSSPLDGMGTELWRSDGTTQGTFLLGDLNPGDHGSSPTFGAANEEGFVFSATTDQEGEELWTSDGTSSGTHLVEEYRSRGHDEDDIRASYYKDGKLYFSFDGPDYLGRELWISNLDGQGAHLLKDLRPDSIGSDPDQFTSLGSTVLFIAKSTSSYRRFWSSDGTEQGTQQVLPDVAAWELSPDFQGHVYLSAQATNLGLELWKSDGTPAGSHLLLDIYPGSGHSRPKNFFVFKDRLYFSAETSSHGRELWSTDGTVSGTQLFLDCYPGPTSSDVSLIQTAEDVFFFSANDGSGSKIFVSDGTPAGTYPVQLSDRILTASTMGDRLFYVEDDYQVWVCDGTPGGGSLLVEFQSMHNYPFSMAAYENHVYFAGKDDAHGVELWRTDGSHSGTGLAEDVFPGHHSSDPGHLMVIDSNLYFTASNLESRDELWSFDGYCSTMVSNSAEGAMGSYANNFSMTPDRFYYFTRLNANTISIQSTGTMGIRIHDPNLRTHLLSLYDLDANGELSLDEAHQISHLDCSGLGIVQLIGIEKLVNLEWLDASNNEIRDIIPLLHHSTLGTLSTHRIDLSQNLLREPDVCNDLTNLWNRVDQSECELIVDPQRDIFFMPTMDQWPTYNIIELLGGGQKPPDPLTCLPKKSKWEDEHVR